MHPGVRVSFISCRVAFAKDYVIPLVAYFAMTIHIQRAVVLDCPFGNGHPRLLSFASCIPWPSFHRLPCLSQVKPNLKNKFKNHQLRISKFKSFTHNLIHNFLFVYVPSIVDGQWEPNLEHHSGTRGLPF